MLKYLSGAIQSENGEPVQAVAFFMNHTPVAHADVAKSLEMAVMHAGFCDVTENKFLHFYGKSVSTNKGTEGIDALHLNTFVKENTIYQDTFLWWNAERTVFLVFPKGEEPDYSIGFSTDDVYSFDSFVAEVEREFQKRFGA